MHFGVGRSGAGRTKVTSHIEVSGFGSPRRGQVWSKADGTDGIRLSDTSSSRRDGKRASALDGKSFKPHFLRRRTLRDGPCTTPRIIRS